MGLDRPGAVADGQPGDRASVRAGEQLGTVGHLENLVLVAGDEGDRRPGRSHPRSARDDLVVVRADLPSAGRTLDTSPERLRDELMAEADTHVRALGGEQLAEQVLGRRDPRVRLVHGAPARRQQPAVALGARIRESVLIEVVPHELDVGAEQCAEQLRVVPRDVRARGGDVPDEEQTDAGHRKEKTGAVAASSGGRWPASRRRGITPSPNQYASSRCGYPDRMKSSKPSSAYSDIRSATSS